MKYSLVTSENGNVQEVKLYDDPAEAVLALAKKAGKLKGNKDYAAVYSSEGLVVDAAGLLNWYESGARQREQELR